jgi:NADH-quinone oxidoreductase subunit J
MNHGSVILLAEGASRSGIWSIMVTVVLGFATIYMLLPRPRSYPRAWSLVAAIPALLLTGFLLLAGQGWSLESSLFYLFSFVAIVSGGLLIVLNNPLHGALSFALVVLSTCGLFLLQAAPFLMAATMIVYAGAIIVTFIFLIMLAQQAGGSDADQRSREPLLACVTGFALLGIILYVLLIDNSNDASDLLRRKAGLLALPADNVAALGKLLFTDYLLAVELGGTLLLVATIGAVAIAAKRAEDSR